MKKIKIVILFIAISSVCLITEQSQAATSTSCTSPFQSVEQAVICSGGTYGVIDTSNPDGASNFVQTVFDQGLTNNDGNGDCKSMNIRPGVTISCLLNKNNDIANYSYQGEKGEKIKIVFVSKAFDAEVYVYDANGQFIVVEKNYDAKNPLEVSLILPYTGMFIEVWKLN